MKLPKLTINSTVMALLLAVYFTIFLNLAFFRHLHEIFSELGDANIFFILTIPVFLITFFNVLFIPFTIKYFEKPFFIYLLITGSLVNFAMYNYKVIFDQDMIDNILITNFAEASSYSNLTVFLWFGLTGLIPAVLLFFTKITHYSFFKDIAVKTGSVLISLIIVAIIAAFFYKDYASVIRNHKIVRKEIVPTYYMSSTYKYIKKNYFASNMEYTQLGTDAVKEEDGKDNLFVVIVGETARAQNYEFGGYGRETNKYTKNIQNLTYYKNATSCGTATAVSVPCMFSFMGKHDFNKQKARNQDNLTDVLQRAGINTVWIDNNTGSQDVANNIPFIKVPRDKNEFCDGLVCQDSFLIGYLDDYIRDLKPENKENVIFLHIMGSHGPTYYKRYPKDHEVFTPVCDKSDIQNCSDEEILNTYDNTILFTDYVMAEIIDVLKKYDSKYDVSMLYFSDHGESLGEKGLYLHGVPYAIAPAEQTHVPLITWFSDKTVKTKKIDQSCLKQAAEKKHFSHDNLTHTILGMMGVKTSVYDQKMDILNSCRG